MNIFYAWRPLVFTKVLLSSRCHFKPNCDKVSWSTLSQLSVSLRSCDASSHRGNASVWYFDTDCTTNQRNGITSCVIFTCGSCVKVRASPWRVGLIFGLVLIIMLSWAEHHRSLIKLGENDCATAGQLRAASSRIHVGPVTFHLCPNLCGWRKQWDKEPSRRSPRPGPSSA